MLYRPSLDVLIWRVKRIYCCNQRPYLLIQVSRLKIACCLRASVNMDAGLRDLCKDCADYVVDRYCASTCLRTRDAMKRACAQTASSTSQRSNTARRALQSKELELCWSQPPGAGRRTRNAFVELSFAGCIRDRKPACNEPGVLVCRNHFSGTGT